MTCRFNGHDEPRLLNREHLDTCADPDECRGCLECPDDHCVVCTVEHTDDTHPLTCITCVAAIRADLREIPRLATHLLTHAIHGNTGRLAAAPIPGGEAMVAMGPASLSHGRAWYDELGKDSSHRDDQYDADEQTPALILATIEDDWRDLNGDPTLDYADVGHAVKYLDTHLTSMAQKRSGDITENAHDIAGLRHYLEELLGDGVRDHVGAPCVHCGTPLVRVSAKPRPCKHRILAAKIAEHWDAPAFSLMDLIVYLRAHSPSAAEQLEQSHAGCDQGGVRDRWECLRCRRKYNDDQYRFAVGAEYLAKATKLTARELEVRTGVPAAIIRTWGSRGHIRKHGRDERGLLQYDVDDVIEKVPAYEQAKREADARAAEAKAAADRKAAEQEAVPA